MTVPATPAHDKKTDLEYERGNLKARASFPIHRTAHLAKSMASGLGHLLQRRDASSSFRLAGQHLIRRFDIYGGVAATFDQALSNLEKDGDKRSAEQARRGSTPEHAAQMSGGVELGRIDLLKQFVDEEIVPWEKRAAESSSRVQPHPEKIEAREVVLFIFSVGEVGANLVAHLAPWAHFVGPTFHITEQLTKWRQRLIKNPVAEAASILDDLDAFANAARRVVIGAYRLPQKYAANARDRILVPWDKAVADVDALDQCGPCEQSL